MTNRIGTDELATLAHNASTGNRPAIGDLREMLTAAGYTTKGSHVFAADGYHVANGWKTVALLVTENPARYAREINNAMAAAEAEHQDTEQILDALAAAVASPDNRTVPTTVDRDVAVQLAAAGYVFGGRITNEGLAHLTAARGDTAVRAAVKISRDTPNLAAALDELGLTRVNAGHYVHATGVEVAKQGDHTWRAYAPKPGTSDRTVLCTDQATLAAALPYVDEDPARAALTEAYAQINDLYVDRDDRTALALALRVLADLGADRGDGAAVALEKVPQVGDDVLDPDGRRAQVAELTTIKIRGVAHPLAMIDYFDSPDDDSTHSTPILVAELRPAAPLPPVDGDPVIVEANVEPMAAWSARHEIARREWESWPPARRAREVADIGAQEMNDCGGYGASVIDGE